MKIQDLQSTLSQATAGDGTLQKMQEFSKQAPGKELNSDQAARMRDSAQEFEALLVNQMITQMRKTIPESEDGMFGQSHSTKVYQSMLDSEYSKLMSKNQGFGLAEMVLDQFGVPSSENMRLSGIEVPSSVNIQRHESHPTQFLRPAVGRVSSGFGMRIHPLTQQYQMHDGVDVAMPVGSEVHAAESGRISFAGQKRGYGNIVIVEHADGYETRYAHLDKIGVEVGDVVRRGETIAKSGNSGRSTGPHLHFEIIKDGRRLDPESRW